jgi:hypothetical protein
MSALTARLTCPVCGYESVEELPVDQCIFFYQCRGCDTLLKPKSGDCCVFCSYADRPCRDTHAIRDAAVAGG